MTTIAELKAAIRYEITLARARQMSAEESGDDKTAARNREYVHKCEMILDFIETIELKDS